MFTRIKKTKIFLLIFLFYSLVNFGQAFDQIGQFLYGNGNQNLFGKDISVSENGLIMAVGSPATNGGNSNYVDLYNYSSGDWKKIGNTITITKGQNGVINSNFGFAVKLNTKGNRVIIGDPGSFVSGDQHYNPGAFRVYELQNDDWVQIGSRIIGNTHKDGLGTAVDISFNGNIVIASAPYSNETQQGSVRAYKFDGSEWIQLGNDITGLNNNALFGYSVSLSNSGYRIISSSPRTNNWQGNVRVFDYDSVTNTWNEFASPITYSGNKTNARFGQSISANANGTVIAIGAPEARNLSNQNTGIVQVYKLLGNQWVKKGNLISGKKLSGKFGYSVSLDKDGNMIAIGGINDDNNNKGVVRLYSYSEATDEWIQEKTDINGVTKDSQFGHAIALNNNGKKIITSAPYGIQNNVQTGQVSAFAQNQITYIGPSPGFWDNPTNWDLNRLPAEADDVLIPSNIYVIANTNKGLNVNSITVENHSLVSILGSNNVINSALPLKLKNGAQFTSGEDNNNLPIIYERTLTNGWHLVAPPMSNVTIEALIANNTFATGTGDNIGLAPYLNDGSNWNYQSLTSAGPLVEGQGISVKLSTSTDLIFSGNFFKATDTYLPITKNVNSYNLIGNPFVRSLYLNNHSESRDLLSINSNILSEQTIWIWDPESNSYLTINQASDPIIVQPSQGFFVSALNSSNSFLFSLLSTVPPSSSDIFYRNNSSKNNNSRPKIRLTIFSGNIQKSTDIFYISGTTTGWDNGYDSTMFDNANNDLAIYTHLVSNSEGKNLAIQSLPESNYENMVIPIGIKASKDSEIIISGNITNLPDGLNVYLEDKENNSFNLLNSSTSYTVKLSEDLNDVGRFFLHTRANVLDVETEKLLNTNIYLTNKNNLRIIGLQDQPSSIIIYDILGKKIFSSKFNGKGLNDITLPNFKKGLYVIEVKNHNQKINKKIFI